MLVALLPLTFFSLRLPFSPFLRILFVESISDLQRLVSGLQLVFMIGPQLVSRLAWLLQFVEHWIPIVILFWHFLRIAFAARVRELTQLPFIILLSTFIIGLLPFFLKAHAFSWVWQGLLLLLLFWRLRLLFLELLRQPKILAPFFQPPVFGRLLLIAES